MKLVSLGCSWTKGSGSGYEFGMSLEQYHAIIKDRDICDKYAFRTHIAKHLGAENVNLARMGSSNQRQFRLATQYFSEKRDPDTIVLWGITSTARHDIYSIEKKEYVNLLYGNNFAHDKNMEKAGVDTKAYVKNNYDHENEIKQLEYNMKHWNIFFESLGIKNYWFDTFNHHNYSIKIPNMLFEDRPKRDLMTLLCNHYGLDSDEWRYHMSQFTMKDSRRLQKLAKAKKVNPHSFHPTKEAHVAIADMIIKEITSQKI
mgnify:FL=1